jgi:release factor glutamine methyltransferase
MNVGEWLKNAQSLLGQSGISTARLDSLVLLEDVTEHDRAWLLAHYDFDLTTLQLEKLKKLLNRRQDHEPLSFIRGKSEFYGREFMLTADVLEPRPESEAIIDILKALLKDTIKAAHNKTPTNKIHIADVGTGSGAIGITAALELPETDIDLIDIDKKALKVAKTNVDLFTLNISVIESDLLINAPKYYDILLCNLPYVPDNFKVNLAALHEPKIALYGGPDGLDVYRQLFLQVDKLHYQPLYILTESLPPQHELLESIATAVKYQLIKTDDFIQVFKSTYRTPTITTTND